MKKNKISPQTSNPALPNPGFYGANLRSPQMKEFAQFSELSYLGAGQRRAEEVSKVRNWDNDLSNKSNLYARYSGQGTFCYGRLFPKKGVENK